MKRQRELVSLDHHVADIRSESEYVKAAFLAHDPKLEVKKSYAEQMEKEAIIDLIKERKGILILDLDHTLFQVTLRPISQEYVGIETWNFATELAHSGRLMEGKTYWFNLDSAPSAPPFFIHLRPGLYSFLETAAKMFELYAYTQGTNEYAKKILTGIDPCGDWFGSPSRLIAREVDPTTGATIRKSVSRVFPSEEDLVLIIDDRDDVWDKRAGACNLIKLAPFLFFPDPDREKLIGLTMDTVFHPGKAKPLQASSDCQLSYLEPVLGDIHSEVFFSTPPNSPNGPPSLSTMSSISNVLVEKKRSLLEGFRFLPNERISGNIFRLIREFGGVLCSKHDEDSENQRVCIQLGVPGQARKGPEPDLIHPWFVLFCVSTLSVPADISQFAISRIEEEGIGSVWECVNSPNLDENESELALLQDLLG